MSKRGAQAESHLGRRDTHRMNAVAINTQEDIDDAIAEREELAHAAARDAALYGSVAFSSWSAEDERAFQITAERIADAEWVSA